MQRLFESIPVWCHSFVVRSNYDILYMLLLAYLWASPWTLFGLFWGSLALLTGGRGQLVQGVIEFHGGFPAWLLRRMPIVGGAAAITFGHVVLARTLGDLDASRAHERVHVCQYERWGLFFIPAYLLCSLWLLLRRRRPYWDNPFEREAYGTEGQLE